MKDIVLSVSNLCVRFARQPVIQDLTFEMHTGETLAVIGPNGAGKTVLLKALLHLIPYAGEICWAGNTRLGYVPQKTAADRQLPLHVRDLLNAKINFLKLPETEVLRVAAAVGLPPEFLNANLGTLSGGQFQKALIAFALLGQPNVILFDEPTASLDELAEERIYDLLQQLKQEHGLTIILVSHDLSVVYRYATTVLCLNKAGVCFGNPKEVLTPEALEALYSAPPKYYQHLHDHNAV
jgi:zinc transport system ATP-binding protein